MKTKKRRGKKRRTSIRIRRKRRRALAAAGIFLLLAVGIGTGLSLLHAGGSGERPEEVRAVWVSYMDFKALDLYNRSEDDFRHNGELLFQEAEKYAVNTVYFHVRAFRDAAYPSETFPISRYIWDREEDIPYDPLEIMTELAKKHDMELHAWLNPYRNRDFDKPILNPASEKSTEEILLCVREILDNYDVAGIHFDDYFYKEDSKIPERKMKENVNRMVRAVYREVKSYDRELQFGISPAGNVSYCESIGADVRTWVAQKGYVDYIIPQIYWTDQHSAAWREKMFTDTLDEWIDMNEAEIPIYIGLALYRTGKRASDDPGWGKSSTNLARQVARLREKNCGGFALFSAKDFLRRGAQRELENYQKEVLSE